MDQSGMNDALNQRTILSTLTEAQILPIGSYAYLRPRYLKQSAWIEHIPFAFWLTEALRPSLVVELGTHWGTSYFAFCQALEKLDIGAQAFAVDRWTGDEHAGAYGGEVYQYVKDYNEDNYSIFSTLMKKNFDEANEYFLDGSIDVLHIDGFHSYEAVRNDFDKWLPKISNRGVVLLHDTNVRERNFGVFRLFDELREKYPVFEFFHGHGLGVVGVGGHLPERLRLLLDAEHQNGLRRDVQHLFSSLGKACLDSYDNKELRKRVVQVTKLEKEVGEHKNKVQELAALAAERELNIRVLEEKLSNNLNYIEVAQQSSVQVSVEAADLRSRLADVTSALSQRQLEAEQNAFEISDLRRELAIASESQIQSNKVTEALKEHINLLVRDVEQLRCAQSEDKERCLAQSISIKELNDAASKAAAELAEAKAARDEHIRQYASLENAKAESDLRAQERLVEVTTLTKMLMETEGQASVRSLLLEEAGRLLGRAVMKMLELPNFWRVLPRRLYSSRQVSMLKRSGLFDPEWYRNYYVDIDRAGVDPLRHYVQYGADEGRFPNGLIANLEKAIKKV
ncbi:hypothetical protein GH784_22985 [Agrobacterium sp. CNPSo 675]|nr:hypothetical protein [Agrobacterium tumefaciens]